MKRQLLFTILVFNILQLHSKEFFVSVTGNSNNLGSYISPWNLQTALDHPRQVQPGDTISILEGRYFGKEAEGDFIAAGFISRIKGTREKPIIVRAYPGHRVILDGGNRKHPCENINGLDSHVIGILGDFTWYIGFEITDSNEFSRSGIIFGQTWRVRSMVSIGTGLKLINLIVYDTGNGLGPFSGCVECESYGNIIFYNGWSNLGVRGHGEGFYSQNTGPVKKLHDNIVFKNFDSGMILYGSSQSTIENYDIEGNIIFENGVINDDPNGWGMLFGKNTTATGTGNNFVIKDNYLYNRFDYLRSNNMDLGYLSGLSNVKLYNNYSVGYNAIKYNIPIKGLTATGNTFVGRVEIEAKPQIHPDSNNLFTSSSLPKKNEVFIRPNSYEEGRAHIVVYNWEKKLYEVVNLQNLNLKENVEYELIDVQNLFGPAAVKFKYSENSSTIQIPLNLLDVTKVVGDSVPRAAKHSDGLFNVFLIRECKLINSFEESMPSEIEIFQDPGNFLIVKSINSDNNNMISAFNLTGQVVIPRQNILETSRIVLPEGNLGIILIKIESKNKTFTRKLYLRN